MLISNPSKCQVIRSFQMFSIFEPIKFEQFNTAIKKKGSDKNLIKIGLEIHFLHSVKPSIEKFIPFGQKKRIYSMHIKI